MDITKFNFAEDIWKEAVDDPGFDPQTKVRRKTVDGNEMYHGWDVAYNLAKVFTKRMAEYDGIIAVDEQKAVRCLAWHLVHIMSAMDKKRVQP